MSKSILRSYDCLLIYLSQNCPRLQKVNKNKTTIMVFSMDLKVKYRFILKLLSHPWWILIPKQIKINSGISRIIIINRILLFIEMPCCRWKNVKQIRASSGP